MSRRVKRNRTVVVRDLVVFQIKLLLDGVKDLVVAQLALGAAALDLLFPGEEDTGHRFYAVMRLAERFDRWLSLHGVADQASTHEDGLFGASRAGANTLLGHIEAWVRGGPENELEGDATTAA